MQISFHCILFCILISEAKNSADRRITDHWRKFNFLSSSFLHKTLRQFTMHIQLNFQVEMEMLSFYFNHWSGYDSEKRLNDWCLMSSPFATVAICVLMLTSAKLLHIWMTNRKAISSIRWPIWCFDFFHVTISASLIVITLNFKLLKDFNFRYDSQYE